MSFAIQTEAYVGRAMRGVAAIAVAVLLISCRTASPTPRAVGTLLSEYEQYPTSARQKYDGKEISVQGAALANASMPANADQGLLWLAEIGNQTTGKLSCWFSRQQADEFSQIHTGQYLTIKGVFNGESGVQLKFCRLVRVE